MGSSAEPGRIRRAGPSDLGFLIAADLATGDVEDALLGRPPWRPNPAETAEHAAKIARFLSEPDKAALVGVDPRTGAAPQAMLLACFRDLEQERPQELAANSIFLELDRRLFPADGRFCEVFQLWVEPLQRRRGWAVALKRQLEIETQRRGVCAIYTHTLERNTVVVELNLKLGYHEVRRGPIWDEAVRVSLIKTLA